MSTNVPLEEINLGSAMYVEAMNQLKEKFEENDILVKAYKKDSRELKVFIIHMFGLLKTMDKIADSHELEPNFSFLFENVLFAFEDKVFDIIS